MPRASRCRRRCRRRTAPAGRRLARLALAAALPAAPLAAQLPEFTEAVEVRVVEVEVVATDSDGRPIRGLGPEDFALEVDGRSVEIAYFSAVADGQVTAAAGAASPGSEPGDEGAFPEAAAPGAPYLAVVHDGRTLSAGQGREAIAELRGQLDRLLAATRGVLVARQGRRVSIGPGFSRDRELVDRELAELAASRAPASEVGARRLLLRQLEQTRPTLGGFALGLGDDAERQIEERARRMLQEINAQAENERFETELTLGQLGVVVRTLAGLPGRKAILYLGSGIRTRPADALYRAWWDKFRIVADRLGIASIESEIVRRDLTRPLLDLIAEANGLGVALYTFDARGLHADGFSAEFRTASVTRSLGEEGFLERQNLLTLARATGGAGRINASDLSPLVAEMMDGFGTYYSLGFEPEPGAETGRIEVRLRGPAGRLRYLDRYSLEPGGGGLEQAALAALLTDEAANPLDLRVEVGEPAARRDGTRVLPLLIKVPIARLTLLPRADRHFGRLSLVVVIQDDDGELADPVRGEVPLEIDNDELLASLSTWAGMRLELEVGGGRKRLAVAVRDEVASRDATLRLAVALPEKG